MGGREREKETRARDCRKIEVAHTTELRGVLQCRRARGAEGFGVAALFNVQWGESSREREGEMAREREGGRERERERRAAL